MRKFVLDVTRFDFCSEGTARKAVVGTDIFDAALPYGRGFLEHANGNSQPLAPAQTGLLTTTRIQTPKGPLAISDLRVGTLVCDTAGRTAQVRGILNSPQTRQSLRLRAPYFGLDQDLIVGNNHLVTLASEAAEYLFGEEIVTLPVWALRDNRRVLHHELGPKDKLVQVQLDLDTTLSVGRCAVSALPKAHAPVGRVLNEDESRSFAAAYHA